MFGEVTTKAKYEVDGVRLICTYAFRNRSIPMDEGWRLSWVMQQYVDKKKEGPHTDLTIKFPEPPPCYKSLDSQLPNRVKYVVEGVEEKCIKAFREACNGKDEGEQLSIAIKQHLDAFSPELFPILQERFYSKFYKDYIPSG